MGAPHKGWAKGLSPTASPQAGLWSKRPSAMPAQGNNYGRSLVAMSAIALAVILAISVFGTPAGGPDKFVAQVGTNPSASAYTIMIPSTRPASTVQAIKPTTKPTATILAIVNPPSPSTDPVFQDDGTCTKSDTDSDGDCIVDEGDNCPDDPNKDQSNEDGDDFGDVCDDEEETPPASGGDPGDGITENFNPGPCDEGYAPLPDGFDSPFTSDVIQELSIRVDDVEPLPVTRVGGNECAAWNSRFDARFAAVTCPVGYMCQMGIGHQLETLILGQGQRIRKVHAFTIRYIDSYLGDQAEPGTYAPFTDVPLPSDTEALNDACLFLLKANNWGESDVDDPSWDTVLIEESGFTCGPWTDVDGNRHEVPVVSVDWDSLPNRGKGFDNNSGSQSNGGNGNSLAALNCNNERNVASMFPGTRASNWSPEGTYPNGWVYSGPARRLTVPDSWFRIDIDANVKNSLYAGEKTPRSQEGYTAWCRP